MGVEPNHLIVLPRIIAVSVGLIVMVINMCIWAVIGTAVLMWMEYGHQVADVIVECSKVLSLADVLITLYMIVCLGVVIAVIHCYFGLKSTSALDQSRAAPKVFINAFVSSLIILMFFSIARSG